ncbi:MAG TPA: hypothetical protein VMN60_05445 [Longimicrobiales bacterium]|nr:hypothetical protein [Longimicrobiales bacterium]
MSGVALFVVLTLRSRARRIVALAAFGAVFLLAGATARLFTGGEHGHMELEPLFQLGGSTLVSALLLLGWLVGRFAIIATLVLLSGVFSEDRDAGHARLFAVRPRSLVLLYAARAVVLTACAFAMSALLLPAFDLILLRQWTGSTVFALIAAQVIVFSALTCLLSAITRADAWAALFLGLVALVWDALRRVDLLQQSPALMREAVSMLLPPQGALLRMEAAFGASAPVPLDAFLYVVIYGALLYLLAAVALTRREL